MLYQPDTEYTRAILSQNPDISELSLSTSQTTPRPLNADTSSPSLPEAFYKLPKFVHDIAAAYRSPRQAVLAYAHHLAIAGRDSRPTMPLLERELSEVSRMFLLMLSIGDHFQAELHRDSPNYKFFPASIVCCYGHIKNFGKQDWEPLSRVFALHLPDGEHDKILANLNDSDIDPNVPEAFGYLRYMTDSSGAVRIVEIHNDLYDRLSCAELKERYKDWQHELFDGFIEYVRTSGDMQTAATDEREEAFNAHTTRTIIIPPAGIMIEHAPEIDSALLIERYQELPSCIGFTQQTIPDDTEQVVELPPFQEGLVLAIESPIESRISTDCSRIRELIRLYGELETFPEQNLPLPPLSLPRERLNAPTLYPSFELVSATEVPFENFLSPSLLYQYSQYEQFAEPYRQILDAITGKDFTLISRGFEGGMNDDWAVIPDTSLEPGVYFFPVQSELQNRHPSLRIVLVDESGKQNGFHIAIKGAGVAEKGENSVFELPEGVSAPIYKTAGARVASHRWWGGLPFEEAYGEAANGLALFWHIEESHPTLKNRAPFPLRISVPTMLPVWREEEDGETTEWLPQPEYMKMILAGLEGGSEQKKKNDVHDDSEVFTAQHDITGNESSFKEALSVFYHELPFATLLTVTPSDVRIATMVDRIFYGRSGCGSDMRSQLDDINKVMRFFYHEHGFVLREPEKNVPFERDTLSLPIILNYLRQLSDLNKENAETIYNRLSKDTLAIIRSVHDRGGHFGGGRFKVEEGDVEAVGDETVGIGWGGALALRNFSIKGGINDFADCRFPWASLYSPFCEPEIPKYGEKLRKFDLIYFAETEQWLRLILFGADYNLEASPVKHIFYPEHDLCLYSADKQTPKILAAAKLLDRPETTADELRNMLFGELGE